MGEQNVRIEADEERRLAFMRALLNEVQTLEGMLTTDLFEQDVRRIGAEQEMFLVDDARRPFPVASKALEGLQDPRFTHELAEFNLEANLSPQRLGGDCLSRMEEEARTLLEQASGRLRELGGDVVLCGCLPSLKQSDLTIDNMVKVPRYFALNEELRRLRGSDFRFSIKGIDQLDISHENFMLEACNTSFQVHFQVAPSEFAHLYNIAQAVTGPVLAAAVNSPLLFAKRLWQETRISIFEFSVDTRSEAHQARGHQPRVHFGDHWIDRSVIEIYKEDIARFRVLLATDLDEDPAALVAAGKVPALKALCLHSGTVYRWNRACYGRSGNKAHLRIENRVLPAGPTVQDEIANAAFYFGLLSALSRQLDDIRPMMKFEDAKHNFFTAARDGLNAQQCWLGKKHMPAKRLIKGTLAPLARRGLEAMGIDHADIERYIGTIERRVQSGRTGARWVLDSFDSMADLTNDQRCRNLTDAMIRGRESGKSIEQWPLAQAGEAQDWRESYRRVGQFMTTDLFTVRSNDLVDFAASLMEWRHIRHVLVEDDQGRLVGLVSHRALLRMVARGKQASDSVVPVRDIMKKEPVTVTSDMPTVAAIRLMREQQLGCLPVVDDGRLVGILTQVDLINVAGRVLEQVLAGLDE